MTRGTPSFFELSRSLFLDRWGDYGTILCNGRLRTEGGEQRLDRTAPFVPPISFPPFSDGVVIVTSEARQKLEASGLSGVGEFRPVLLGKVVLVDWQKWDRSHPLDGEFLPSNGEPEEYILENPHDAEAAARIGPIWTWHPSRIGKVLRENGVMRLESIMGKHDVFRLCDAGWKDIIVSENGRRCVGDILGDWVTFERLKEEVLS